MVPMMVLGRGGEGRADGAVPKCFDVEDERGAGMEAHAEDVKEERTPAGVWWENEKVRV
jgi:hypothetical protein